MNTWPLASTFASTRPWSGSSSSAHCTSQSDISPYANSIPSRCSRAAIRYSGRPSANLDVIRNASRLAEANPKHAPYGQRAEEALRAAGVWEKVEPKLVLGENIAQTAQFVQTGNAQVGVIALSLAINAELAGKGGYWLIPNTLHEPLEQGYVITRRAAGNALTREFATYVASPAARTILTSYGFVLPDSAGGK